MTTSGAGASARVTFDPRRTADPLCVSENKRPAHSDHRWFRDADEALSGVSSFEQSLSGTWKLHWARNADGVIDGWQQPGVDTSGWDDVRVPGHLQLQGYGTPQYTNVQYPWDGHEQVAPGQVPTRYNPVASYVTTFAPDRPLEAGERLGITFHGAESAVAVWLNGAYVGYATDSFTPSEFDLTEHVTDGENVLAAQVFTWTSGSWLEDQDFFRFSGLFRDVVLTRRPRVHLEDIRVTTAVSADLAEATVTVRVRLGGPGSVRATLEGVGALEEQADGSLAVAVRDPHLWSAEDPHLHDLVVEVLDDDGELLEHVPLAVGLRRFAIEDGLLRINGQRVVLKGVNRHEFGLNGRVVTREETEADIRILKAAGVNAVRTSHYPNNTYFYELCDRYGLYVIDEMNLETHGLWDAVANGDVTLDEAVPGDRPEWLPALLDRAASMLERDKNHPSVVMWSCGNESFGGSNLLAVADWFREHDDRPIHYEGVHWDPRHPETTDVVSQMYTPAAAVEAFLAEHRDKPFVLCEYAHAMGNSFGAVAKYVDLAYREPLLQGLFVWDFADQAVRTTDRHGRTYDGYGGDFGEAPHDGDFCGNGVVLLDRTPTPKLAELKYLYQPFRLSVTRDELTVENRHLFTGSAAYDVVVTVAREGAVLAEAPLATDVGPGGTTAYPLPVAVPDVPGEYTVDVSIRLRSATAWAPAGHEVASEQDVFRVGAPVGRPPAPRPRLVNGIHNVGVHGPRFSALFSKLHGGLVSYRYAGRELLRSSPRPCFWHAPTANERGWGMGAEDGQWLLASRYAALRPGTPAPEVSEQAEGVAVTYRYALPTVPASGCDVTYLVDGEGRVDVTMIVRPGDGLPDLPELGLLLEVPADLHRLEWYGDGPHEAYADRRGSVRLGRWSAEVTELLTPYLRPQEAGNRTGVRWAAVTDDRGWGMRVSASEADGLELSALPWTPFEIENAAHPVDLPPVQKTVLRPAWRRRGVGGDDSWGARTHPEHLVPAGEELTFRFSFEGVL
ncbi:beta-galactosidase [Nocardioides terrae]|uniref:Beta-galactosidase n=1 Tax=Nocardioides terrae TaxID=574651 RepID=A0A1I1GUV3_9ACTN|nr:glycoside hydrolase family 2 TIM barrel-domain containing protein [Nocardioides terrae]SFC15311.1 beta-galactosidase [Nocardioides terrae]